MKFFLIFICIFNFGFCEISSYFPQLTGRIVDEANILDTKTKKHLDLLLQEEENNSSNQIVIATIKSLHNYDIEYFSIQLARHWKIGQKDKNNGILLLIAPNEKQARIEVGYGLEGDLTDIISSEILNDILIPEFKKQNYNQGILNTTNAIINATKGQFLDKNKDTNINFMIVSFIGFFMLIIGAIIKNKILYKIGFLSFCIFFLIFIISQIFIILQSFTLEIIVFSLLIIGYLSVKIKLKKLDINNNNKHYFNSSNNDHLDNSKGGFSGGGGNFGGGGASASW